MVKKVVGGIVMLAVVVLFQAAGQEQVASVSPAKLKVGEKIAITYHAGSRAATLRETKEITVEVLVIRDADVPLLLELPMKSAGKDWSCSFTLKEKKAQLLLMQFASGEKTDDNGGNVWDFLVYGSNGEPVRNAHLQRAAVVQRGGFLNFKCQKDLAVAKQELAEESKAYPDNWKAAMGEWSIMSREKPGDETMALIKDQLDKVYGAHKTDETAVADLLVWFEQTGQQSRADDIRQAAIRANPKGTIAENTRLLEVYNQRDPEKRVDMLQRFLKDFPQKGDKLQNYRARLVGFLSDAGRYDEAASMLDRMKKNNGGMYNDLAWPLIEKGEQLKKAVAWAKKAVDLLRHPDPSMKPPYYSKVQWKDANESTLGMVLDTYAFGLFQLGKTGEAESAYREAYGLMKGQDADVNQRYVACLVKNGKYKEAIATSAESIKKGMANDKLMALYKAAFVKVNGSERGFEGALGEARDEAKREMKKELMKERINKPEIDFTLRGLDGKTVTLSDLKGKVVVLDFWATWCGPCKASFPALQKLYEKYKDNSKIVILALDTWERVAGAEREDAVKKFIADNKYTFPVLYDEGFVEKYGVEGIPTKFVIDKKGMIQFKSVGYYSDQKMVDEMELWFEILLDDNFYSMSN
jgi:thiol-disulfide isomerase/thioredoxin